MEGNKIYKAGDSIKGQLTTQNESIVCDRATVFSSYTDITSMKSKKIRTMVLRITRHTDQTVHWLPQMAPN